jgi:hypothetical protein
VKLVLHQEINGLEVDLRIGRRLGVLVGPEANRSSLSSSLLLVLVNMRVRK